MLECLLLSHVNMLWDSPNSYLECKMSLQASNVWFSLLSGFGKKHWGLNYERFESQEQPYSRLSKENVKFQAKSTLGMLDRHKYRLHFTHQFLNINLNSCKRVRLKFTQHMNLHIVTSQDDRTNLMGIQSIQP